VTEVCQNDDVWPVSKVVVIHAQGKPHFQKMAMVARNISDDIAFSARHGMFGLCRGDPGRLAKITGLEELRRWTPVVKFRKGGQAIRWTLDQSLFGPETCRQCFGLRQDQQQNEKRRLTEWNRTGWSGFYESP
jgi:hypothetical protein